MSSSLLVQIPPELRRRLKSSESSEQDHHEARGHTRVNALIEGYLRILQSPRVLRDLQHKQSSRIEAGMFVKDISRTGVGLYYHEQLFPREIVELEVQHRIMKALVVRCRYIGPKCFDIGCKVLTVHSLD
jgi:hypothetical protein